LGLLVPLAVLLVERSAGLISPTVILSIWPTSIILLTDAKSAVGWILDIVSILLNGLCYGVVGAAFAAFIRVPGEKSPYH